MLKKNDIITVKIEDLTNLGFGVARHTGIVVFVSDTVPGDECEVKIIKLNKSYAVGRAERFLLHSPLRTDGRCPITACKSCAYRHISYNEELKLKTENVRAAFNREGLGKITVEPAVPSPKSAGYRNKAQYPISRTRDGDYVIGFYAPKSHRVTEARRCPLTPGIFAQILDTVAAFLKKHDISVYDEESGRGLLRHVYLRRAEVGGEILVTLVINGKELPSESELVSVITKNYPDVVGILINENLENTNVVLGDNYRSLWGRDYIFDTLGGVRLKITAPSFYQVNREAADLLYAEAKRLASPKKSDVLLDLYCGAGSIGLSMANEVGELIGIEIIKSAVECAKFNAESNRISNAKFYTGDASDTKKLLSAAERELKRKIEPTVIILDPPRAGCAKELVEYAASLAPDRIVYVSCNPATLARDVKLFSELGYTAESVKTFDLFPMTGHVESVVLLKRKINVHKMKLNAAPFEMIKSGEKTFELRLYDEKRRQIKVGDRIVFTNNTTKESLDTSVLKLYKFDTFDELYKSLPLLKCGYTSESVDKAEPADMKQYYSVEEQNKYGVIAIELCRPKQNTDENAACLNRK